MLPSGARVKAFADRSEIVGLGFYVDESGLVDVLAVVGVGVLGTAVCCVVVKDEARVGVAGWSEGLTGTGVESFFPFLARPRERAHRSTRARMHARMHTCTCTRTSTRKHTCTHTLMHAYAHTHTLTHTHTHTTCLKGSSLFQAELRCVLVVILSFK